MFGSMLGGFTETSLSTVQCDCQFGSTLFHFSPFRWVPLLQMFGKILTPTKWHTAVKTLRGDEVMDVRVREQIFASVRLYRLVKKALGSETIPIV
jgi:hypothetical protein